MQPPYNNYGNQQQYGNPGQVGQGPGIPPPDQGAAQLAGKLLKQLPPSYPSIAAQTYHYTAPKVDSNQICTIQAPSDCERLLGLAVRTSNNSDGDIVWTAGIQATVKIVSETVMEAEPLETFYPGCNNYELGYFPISRPVKAGDAITVAFSTDKGNIPLWVTAIFMKINRALN